MGTSAAPIPLCQGLAGKAVPGHTVTFQLSPRALYGMRGGKGPHGCAVALGLDHSEPVSSSETDEGVVEDTCPVRSHLARSPQSALLLLLWVGVGEALLGRHPEAGVAPAKLSGKQSLKGPSNGPAPGEILVPPDGCEQLGCTFALSPLGPKFRDLWWQLGDDRTSGGCHKQNRQGWFRHL